MILSAWQKSWRNIDADMFKTYIILPTGSFEVVTSTHYAFNYTTENVHAYLLLYMQLSVR